MKTKVAYHRMNNNSDSPRFSRFAFSFDGDGDEALALATVSGATGTTGGAGSSGYGYVVVPSITSEEAAAAAAFENCVDMWLKICEEMLSVRRKVFRRRSSDDVGALGAGAAPPVVGVTGMETLEDWESSLLSRRTSRSSVLMANHLLRGDYQDTVRSHMNQNDAITAANFACFALERG